MKTNNNTYKQLTMLSLFITSLLLIGCQSPFDEPLETGLPGYIIYVEDLTGYYGLTAGQFGNLVLIDGKNNLKRVLTNDRYFYRNPNLVNGGQGIVFESKRGNNIGVSGLSTNSALYYMDTETLQISLLETTINRKFNKDFDLTRAHNPFVFRNSELGFYMNAVDLSDSMMHFLNTESGTLNHSRVLSHFRRTGDDMPFQSTGGRLVIFGNHRSLGYIQLYDRDEDEFVLRIDNEHPDVKGNISACRPGMWEDDNTFYYSCHIHAINLNQIFRYTLDDSVSTLITSFHDDKLRISDLHITQNREYFVFLSHRIIESGFYSDIYKYNIKKSELTNLTNTTPNAKGFMRYYEHEEDIPEWNIW